MFNVYWDVNVIMRQGNSVSEENQRSNLKKLLIIYRR